MKSKIFIISLLVAITTGLSLYWSHELKLAEARKSPKSNVELNIAALCNQEDNSEKGVGSKVENPSGDSEKGALTREECIRKGGIWNRSTEFIDSDFEKATCKVSGEINVFGVSVKGSYEAGGTYSIPWASYRCTENEGECCLKQGLYTGDKKLA